MQERRQPAAMAPFGLRASGRSANRRRTSPLWGLGMSRTVSPDTVFLHHGRERTIDEAELWHGERVPKRVTGSLHWTVLTGSCF
jgi:CxxC motif-containing protein (DUF1111 family)